MNIFRLTDGVNTVNLNDCNAISVEGNSYAPTMARTRDGRWQDTADNVTLRVKATTGALVMSQYNDLVNMLDQASRFGQGENVNPVLLQWRRASGSTLWSVLVVGGLAQAPGTFVNQESYKLLFPVQMQVVRRGQWLTYDSFGTNYVQNGSFETWAGDPLVPSNWTIIDGSFSRSTAQVKHGTYSILCEGMGDNFVTDTGLNQIISGVPAGFQIRFSCWIYVVTGIAKVSIYNPGLIEQANVSGASWQRVDLAFIAATNNIDIFFEGTSSPTPTDSYYIDDVKLEIMTPVPGATHRAAHNTVTNGDMATLSFSANDLDIPSPAYLSIVNLLLGTPHPEGFLALSDSENGISIINASGYAAQSAAYTSVSDTAAFARGSNVLRYTPTVTTEKVVSISANPDIKRAIMLVSARNNSTTTANYTIRASSAGHQSIIYNRSEVLPAAASQSPQWFNLGAVSAYRVASNPNNSSFYLNLTASVTGAGTLDIGVIVLLDLTTGNAYLTKIEEAKTGGTTSRAVYFSIDPAPLTSMETIIGASMFGRETAWGISGSRSVYLSGGVKAVLMMTGRASTANTWRQVNTSGAVTTNNWMVSRLPGVLIPE